MKQRWTDGPLEIYDTVEQPQLNRTEQKERENTSSINIRNSLLNFVFSPQTSAYYASSIALRMD